jgi:hypothetical protein
MICNIGSPTTSAIASERTSRGIVISRFQLQLVPKLFRTSRFFKQ